jgi:replicative DNA helicase
MSSSQYDQDVYAEQGVLAGILEDPDIFDAISNLITEYDFNEPRHRKIYSSIASLRADNTRLTLVALGDRLRSHGHLVEVGGLEYLTTLTDPEQAFAVNADPLTYASIVLDESRKRQLGQLAKEIYNLSKLDSGQTSEEAIAESLNKVRELSESGLSSDDAPQSLADLRDEFLITLDERASSDGSLQGVPSGFYDLDNLTTGFLPGQMIVIAARPAVGKSTLAADMARAAAFKADKTVLFFSLEMSRSEIMDRITAAESDVLLNNIRSGELSGVERDRIMEGLNTIGSGRLHIKDQANMTINSIRLDCLRQASTPEGLDLIVLDYLQLMESPGKVESRQQAVSTFSRQLKMMAKELGVPMIVLSQLNRGSEQRSDKKPAMSDLRESGSIEQDADIVLLLHRPETEAQTTDRTMLIVAKNRNGPTDNVLLAPLLQFSKFANGSGAYPSGLAPEVFGPSDPPPPLDEFGPPVDDESAEPDGESPAW